MKLRRPSRRFLLALVAGGALGIVVLRQFERSQVYHPDRVLIATGRELGRPCEDVRFRTADGLELNGWYYPAATNSPRRRLAFLFCHGNAGNISHRLETCDALLSTGASVFVFDYRGYGRSQGRPSEAGTYLDAEAAYDWLRGKGFAPGEIIVFGESLGGGIAAELCTRRETGGLVLQSTFTSIPDLGAELFPWLPVRLLARIHYDTLHKLPRLHIPVLVMHSRADDLVGYHHAERNFAAANEPKLFCEIEGPHNEPLTARDRFLAGLQSLLKLVAQPD